MFAFKRTKELARFYSKLTLGPRTLELGSVRVLASQLVPCPTGGSSGIEVHPGGNLGNATVGVVAAIRIHDSLRKRLGDHSRTFLAADEMFIV